MWIFFKLTLRNLMRFKRRTLITFITSSFGLALLILSLSLMNGIDKDSVNNIINSHHSPVTLYAPGYFDKRDEMPLSPSIENPERYQKELGSLPMVRAVEGRIRFAASLIRQSDELPCMGVAVDPALNPLLFNIKERLVSGEWLNDDETIVIGKNLAQDLGLSIGDIVTVRLITSRGDDPFSWNAIDVTIKGVFDSGNPGIDSAALFMPLRVAQKALSMSGRVSEIALRLEDESRGAIEEAKMRVTRHLSHKGLRLEAFGWMDLENLFLAVSEMKTQRSAMIIMIMLFIAAVGIVNTMMMAVMERTREIGMMSAMGLKRREIMTLFIMEGGLIGMIGSFLGASLGSLMAWYFQAYGMSLRPFGEVMTRMSQAIYPIKETLYADLTFKVVAMVFLFGTVIAVLASSWPAYRAARMDPIQALRNI